jgi:hypothetical protein
MSFVNAASTTHAQASQASLSDVMVVSSSQIPAGSQLSASQWSNETNLVLEDGKVKLTQQTVVVRSVITESFNILLGDLLFKNAYPDATETYDFISNAILIAASGIKPASEVYCRLLQDQEYFTKVLRQVCHILECPGSGLANISVAAPTYQHISQRR